MPTPSTINKLPLDTRIELKRRLRSGQYSILNLAEWLKTEGYATTKSAIGRYAIKLREEDTHLGHDREFMAKGGSDIVALFEELYVLKAREAEVLAQIRMAMIP